MPRFKKRELCLNESQDDNFRGLRFNDKLNRITGAIQIMYLIDEFVSLTHDEIIKLSSLRYHIIRNTLKVLEEKGYVKKVSVYSEYIGYSLTDSGRKEYIRYLVTCTDILSKYDDSNI